MMNEIDCFFSFSLSNQNKVCRHHFSVKLSIAIHRLFLMCFFSLHLLFIDSTQGFWIKIVFTIFCVRRTAHRFQLIITHFVFILFNLALIILDFSPQVCVYVLLLAFRPSDNKPTRERTAYGEWRRVQINCSNWNKIHNQIARKRN